VVLLNKFILNSIIIGFEFYFIKNIIKNHKNYELVIKNDKLYLYMLYIYDAKIIKFAP